MTGTEVGADRCPDARKIRVISPPNVVGLA